ncbi:Mitochondrial import receptor subunit TOM7 [Grifola frondosa]|uniref:Mitochondrial import receptor subunit TOM7 n=1 Tax=Grifola frondosa TaxID=5627 RepID=A0A1C7M4M9_GRIFR|nr:Mitochondrial import receptor subunit TOM7 [Grifola frondosa]
MPSEETKERIIKGIELGRTILHYGWIPLIIYIGYTRSNPQPSLIKLISPLHDIRHTCVYLVNIDVLIHFGLV